MNSTIWKTQSKSILGKGAAFLYWIFFAPRSSQEDSRRHELILNIILFSINVLALTSLIVVGVRQRIEGAQYQGVALDTFLIIVLAFLFLYILSRIGYFIAASYLFIGIYLLSVSYAAYRFEVDLPIVILSFALGIVFSTILINSTFGFFITALIAAIVVFTARLQINHQVIPKIYWKQQGLDWSDIVEFVVLYAIMMAMSWLSNREMEASLSRARRSEKELRQERDSLEIKVDQRTRELRRAQLERITQLDRFVEFGRMASGLFHDITNSLTAVTLSIRRLKNSNIEDTENYLAQAEQASKNMGEFMQAVRRQLQSQESQKTFSLNEELENVLRILDYKAKSSRLELKYSAQRQISFYGNPLKFHQVAINLISNAIDAYNDFGGTRREVEIKLFEQSGLINLTVRDFGIGIAPENLGKIFEPFFTTKKIESGTGIGLTITKDIVETEFNGKITVESTPDNGKNEPESGDNAGTLFAVEFPPQHGVRL